jgi:hypothetical protein
MAAAVWAEGIIGDGAIKWSGRPALGPGSSNMMVWSRGGGIRIGG